MERDDADSALDTRIAKRAGTVEAGAVQARETTAERSLLSASPGRRGSWVEPRE